MFKNQMLTQFICSCAMIRRDFTLSLFSNRYQQRTAANYKWAIGRSNVDFFNSAFVPKNDSLNYDIS